MSIASSTKSPRSSMVGPMASQISNKSSPSKNRIERQTNFKVVIRVRPPLPRELSGEIPFQNIVAVDDKEQIITVSENLNAVLDSDGNLLANPGPYATHTFAFDYVYDQNAGQKKVYDNTAKTVVDSSLQGYNATIFAYGQTGTGKTFTMEGFNSHGSVEARGIIPRAIEQIFSHISKNASPRMRFLVRASYLQIYNEQISDLLKPERSNLVIREDKKRGVFVDGISEWVVRSPAEIYGLMERGGAVRATGETKMNEYSSRSHSVFIVIAEQSETVYVDDHGAEMSPEEFQKFMHGRGVRREQEMVKLEDHVRQSFKVGKLNLVDLAGSERVRLSGATGQRLEESKQINKSLSALGNVISALTDTKGRQHIPYRDSKLTRMLEDSLGGNCKTTMMAMISPALESMVETLSTLKFANRAKNIRNEARVNEDLDQKSLLRKYERELRKLRAELEARSKNVVDKRRLLELDEQRRRAEADKMAAIRALEARSLEFMQEKEEKKKLEQRIAMLMGQMIRGDRSPGANGDTAMGLSKGVKEELVLPGSAPEIQVMMKQQQDKLRQEYEGKLAEIERERETIEEEKAQVDRYKQLLLKQRDIMIALTQRLVERDEQIMALQDELDAYDRHQKELEEKLDEKTAMLIKFQRISMEVNASSPYKNEELTKALDSWSKNDSRKHLGVTEIDNENNGDDDDAGPIVYLSDKVNSSDDKKIAQLQMIVAAQRLKINQLEESSIRKSSSVIDAHSVEKSTDELSQNQSQLLKLKDENTKLVAHIKQLESSQNFKADAPNGNFILLQVKCDTLSKERDAMHTIMEQKIKVLVESVAKTVSTVLQSSPQNGGVAGLSLSKDVAALQRLVNASIAALRNAHSQSTSSLPLPIPQSSKIQANNGRINPVNPDVYHQPHASINK